MCITHSYFPSLLTSCRVGVGLALGLLVGLACPAQATGSWTPLSAQAPDAIGTTMLLTDGTVMAQGTTGAAGANGSGSSAHWYKLTPDAHGSYANGTWTKLADMHHERLYYASAVLRDGRVFVAGGEYTEAGYVDTNTAEIYDPVKDAWTEISSPAGWANIGDAPTKMLADGTVLLGRINGYETALYNPVTNTWAAGANNLGGCSEASWTLLPDQSILTVDINYSPNAERYLPSSGIWVAAGQTPVSLVAGSEIGPAVLMPSGQCLYVGATGHTAVYTLASSGAGTWAAGPDFPTDSSGNQLEAKDAPGCLLVNGKVLCVVAPHGTSDGGYPFGQRFFEYTSDPSGLSGGSLAAAPDSGLNSANMPAFTGRFLALPSGEALYSNFNSELMVYTPDSGPNPAWKPAISGVAAQADGSYQVSGTQFNGLSEGSGYGDDASQSTNYPLVRLTSGVGVVSYARTFNHSTMALATGGLPVATSFTLPAGLAPGAYQLQVVANGISSDPVSFTVPTSTSASFVGADAATQGNWKGVYGADGYTISQDLSAGNPALPAYATVALVNSGNYTWAASTADPRGLLKAAPNAPDRLAACWYSGGATNSFDVDVSLTDGQAHRVSLYALDWDRRGRIDAVTVRDAATGATLDAQTAGAAATGGGVYLTWAVRGHVVFHVACANPPGNFNAVLSALFFDPAASPALSAPTGLKATAGDGAAALSWNAVAGAASYSVYRATASGAETLLTGGLTAASFADAKLTNGATYFYKVAAVNGAGEGAKSAEVSATPQASSASFVGADAATQGNWKGVYGADGYTISQDLSAGNPALPAYATVAIVNSGNYTWAASTADPRGLLKAAPNAPDRLAACWYSGGATNSFDVDVSLTDGQAHRVSLYALDWDRRGRIDAVTVRDAATGATLDAQTAGAAATGGGAYLTWAVRGHVVFHVACANPPGNFNAVLSALFFDPSR